MIESLHAISVIPPARSNFSVSELPLPATLDNPAVQTDASPRTMPAHRVIMPFRKHAKQMRTNEQWLQELTAEKDAQAEAIRDLRALLVRGALYSLRQTRYRLATWDEEHLNQLAQDSAQDALLAVLEHLHEFRGESRFTTWAFKFAVNKALMCARHESWKHISLDEVLNAQELDETPFVSREAQFDPDRMAWRTQVWAILRQVIETELTPHQREVLIAIAFHDVPLDELADQFHTNRNAIYKTVHDARRKLKARLVAQGLEIHQVMDLFART